MQGMGELSGKEGESILLSSRVTANSIGPVIETFSSSDCYSILLLLSSLFCKDDAAYFLSCLSAVYLVPALLYDRLCSVSGPYDADQADYVLLCPRFNCFSCNSQNQ